MLQEKNLIPFITSLKARGIRVPQALVSEDSVLSHSIKSGHFELYKLLWAGGFVHFTSQNYKSITKLLIDSNAPLSILEFHLAQTHAIGLFLHLST